MNGQEGEPRTLDGAIPKSLVLDSDSGSESHTQESDAEDKDGEYTPGLEVVLPTKKGRGPAVPRKLSRGTVSLSARGSGLNIATKSVGGVQGGVSTETSGLTMATKGVMQSLGSDVTSLAKGGAAAVGRGVAAPAGRGVATVVGAGEHCRGALVDAAMSDKCVRSVCMHCTLQVLQPARFSYQEVLSRATVLPHKDPGPPPGSVLLEVMRGRGPK